MEEATFYKWVSRTLKLAQMVVMFFSLPHVWGLYAVPFGLPSINGWAALGMSFSLTMWIGRLQRPPVNLSKTELWGYEASVAFAVFAVHLICWALAALIHPYAVMGG